MRAAIVIAFAIAILAPARARAKGCHEISHVVGYEKCSRFGKWSRDQDIVPLVMEVGWLHETYPTKPFVLGSDADARTIGGASDTMPSTVSNGVSIRWLAGNRLLYGGLEFDSGGMTQMPQFANLPAGTGATFEGLGVFGVHASLWRFAAGLELAAGARGSMYSYCGNQKSCSETDTVGQGIVEARVRVEWFPVQDWSFGVAWGHSLLDSQDRSFYVFTGIHMRALDGMY
jgi:hypothetical protein